MYQQTYHKQDLKPFRFLVTGGAGFIGSHIVEYLLTYGAGKVRVLDNFSTGSINNIRPFFDHPAFEFIEGDIRDFKTCQQAVSGIDYVSHQAALGSVPRSIDDPITSNEVNVSGFLNILVAAQKAGIKKMVYAASSSTYGDSPDLPKVEDKIGNPLSPYAITKFVNELYGGVFSKQYGFHTIGLRYFNVFGPRQNPNGPYAAVIPLFITAALKNESPFINGDGESSRDFTFVENAVQANIKGLLSTGSERHEVVNIAFGERTSLNQLWNHITEMVGVSLQPNYRDFRQGDVKHSLASINKAKNLIGYEPKVSVKAGLKMSVDWYNTVQTPAKVAEA
jgi:UDP-N-acetylglucosamine/UDP-N-acetyl-alpha-D-glucosaminouronate 4-epimerase